MSRQIKENISRIISEYDRYGQNLIYVGIGTAYDSESVPELSDNYIQEYPITLRKFKNEQDFFGWTILLLFDQKYKSEKPIIIRKPEVISDIPINFVQDKIYKDYYLDEINRIVVLYIYDFNDELENRLILEVIGNCIVSNDLFVLFSFTGAFNITSVFNEIHNIDLHYAQFGCGFEMVNNTCLEFKDLTMPYAQIEFIKKDKWQIVNIFNYRIDDLELKNSSSETQINYIQYLNYKSRRFGVIIQLIMLLGKNIVNMTPEEKQNLFKSDVISINDINNTTQVTIQNISHYQKSAIDAYSIKYNIDIAKYINDLKNLSKKEYEKILIILVKILKCEIYQFLNFISNDLNENITVANYLLSSILKNDDFSRVKKYFNESFKKILLYICSRELDGPDEFFDKNLKIDKDDCSFTYDIDFIKKDVNILCEGLRM
jgi:hypothetical protein